MKFNKNFILKFQKEEQSKKVKKNKILHIEKLE